MTKGGGAPVPDLATGVFPLRPREPRKITIQFAGSFASRVALAGKGVRKID